MDMSIVEGEERHANVNEVADYVAEIHTHLRAMEVCIFGCFGYLILETILKIIKSLQLKSGLFRLSVGQRRAT